MAKARIAGEVFKNAKGLLSSSSKFLGIDKMNTMDKILRFGPDAAFATMNAVSTPGDLGDKLLAGGLDFAGSSLTGLTAAAPFKGNPGVAAGIDQIGSIAGGYGGHYAGMEAQKIKDKLMGGKGLSAYEKANIEYENQLTGQIIADLNAAGLLTPYGRAMLMNDNTGVQP